MVSGETLFVWTFTDFQSDFGCYDYIVSVIFQKLAHDLLGSSVRIEIGSVEEIDSEIQCSSHYRRCLVDLNHPFLGVAERHGSQANPRDLYTGRTEPRVLHS